MKIGILTYHSVYNFGANLQVLSTFYYFKNKGYDVKVINWRPTDIRHRYNNNTSLEQANLHEQFFGLYNMTRECLNEKDILEVIDTEKIDAIVIGSDAVLQVLPMVILYRPTRRFKFNKAFLTVDQKYPNPFWGTFNYKLKSRIPLVLMSVSAQYVKYSYFSCYEKKRIMHSIIDNFNYISVRDTWTQNYFKYISNSKLIPTVTPDPVFAFNKNVPSNFLNNNFREKFGLLDKYILLSFKKMYMPDLQWIKDFEQICNFHNIQCVSLPYPQEESNYGMKYNIKLPLSPIDWYQIIANSNGYVGNNMHPIVVSIHNSIPFFAFDQYVLKKRNGVTNLQSSKVFDLINRIGLTANYQEVTSNSKMFSPKYVFDQIFKFDLERAKIISNIKYLEYTSCMIDIESAINNTHIENNL